MMQEPMQPFSAEQPDMVPIIEVSFGRGMFWSLPQEMSKQVFEKYQSGGNAGYTWDWGDSREGTWRPDDEPTSMNRYVIGFDKMEQTNIGADRKRSIRIVWTTQPQWVD